MNLHVKSYKIDIRDSTLLCTKLIKEVNDISRVINIKGKFADAIVFTKDVDKETLNQIENLLNHKMVEGQIVRIMPDCHAGLGCVIGTTMTISDKVVPNLVGVDIGCGMLTSQLGNANINFEQLDSFIRSEIPAGFNIRNSVHPNMRELDIKELKALRYIDYERAVHSVGTLGGGNHFIEVGKDSNGVLYLIVHTGSRHLGSQIAEHYQRLAIKTTMDKLKEEKEKEILELNPSANLKKELRRFERGISGIEKQLMYLEDKNMDDYLHDMRLVQKYASLNRRTITEIIIKGLGLDVKENFETIHNYINLDEMILRKGAISAKKGEKVLIPMNMRDGSLLCVGKGNQEWNMSAPHGAGRLMSRKEARDSFKLEDFKTKMEGVFTTSVSKATLDEDPDAYKPMDTIMEAIDDTVEIIDRLIPVYNFKSN